ncbi:MAG: glycoside hydrolase family 3 protein [Clostridia bacterium]|nr:glycoside hydrolase family 3 protein [Clostridia bacterium]
MKKPLLSEMTLREKINQMIILAQWDLRRRFENGEDYKVERPEEEQIEMLKREQFGSLYAQYGTIVKGRNTDLLDSEADERCKSTEFADMINWEASFLKIPPLVGGDSERSGAGAMHYDLTSIISPLAMGATDDENLVYEIGAALGRELRCTGVNWRWSPVVDITNRFSNICHVNRVFTDMDVEKQSRLAIAMIKGMQSEGVAATAKHFPGNDPYEYRDGHFCSSSISVSKEEWWKTQGVIFQNVIDAGVYAIMTSHQSFPAIDDSTINGQLRPTTISKKITTDLLKKEMGFEGVIITDGITMGGLASILPWDELIVECVNAGNDVILCASPLDTDTIEKAVLDGRIEESRIDDACQRVLNMKEKLGLFEDGYVNVKYKAEDVRDKTAELSLTAARKAVTLVRDRNSIFPLDKNNIKKVSIIVSSHSDTFYQRDIQHLKKEFEDRGIEVYMQRRLNNGMELEGIANSSDLIIYAAMVSGHMPKGAAALVEKECETYFHAFKYGKEKTIGMSCGSPYLEHDIMEGADAFINLYGTSPYLLKAFVEAIFGEIPFEGKSPVNLKPPKFVYED